MPAQQKTRQGLNVVRKVASETWWICTGIPANGGVSFSLNLQIFDEEKKNPSENFQPALLRLTQQLRSAPPLDGLR